MHVKGLELPGYEPRTLHAMALGLAVNARERLDAMVDRYHAERGLDKFVHKSDPAPAWP